MTKGRFDAHQTASPFSKMTSFLLDLSTERLIAISRLALASFALLSIFIDPSQPADYVLATYSLLVGYLFYSLLLALHSWRYPNRQIGRLATQLIDLATFSVLMQLTAGPTSPYFVLFTFSLLSATLRWSWRGALATACALFALLLVSTVDWIIAERHDSDLTRIVMRGTYLVVAGAMLGYVGAYGDRSRARFIKLAEWPPEQISATSFPALERSLGHAADVAGAERILTIWEEVEEPFVNVAIWTKQAYQTSQEPPGSFGSLVDPEVDGLTFMSGGRPHLSVMLADGSLTLRFSAITPKLVQDFRIERSITAPILTQNIRGRIFLLDSVPLTEDMAMLAKIVASRIGIELEHHCLRRELAQTVALRERVRMARDIHDGTLQGLTATGLRLRVLAQREEGGDIAEQLEEIRRDLADQQRRLRVLVKNLFSTSLTDLEEISLRSICEEVLASSGRQWSCELNLEISPEDVTVRRSLGEQVSHLLTEAVANAARHGGASRLEIKIARTPTALRIRICDNGQGFKDLSGTFDHATLEARRLGPRSIRERVAGLGGALVLSSSADGAELDISFPP